MLTEISPWSQQLSQHKISTSLSHKQKIEVNSKINKKHINKIKLKYQSYHIGIFMI